MIVDLVTFRVKSGKEQEFEAQQQEWAALMRRARGFINQVLMRNLENPSEYQAEVRWVNRDYRDRFSRLKLLEIFRELKFPFSSRTFSLQHVF